MPEKEDLESGEKILQLLKNLDSEPIFERVQKLYQSAYKQRSEDPDRALEDCQKALEEIDLSSETAFDHSMIFARSRGKFYLLMASIHLDEATVTSWQEAEKNYLLSQEEFRTRGWSHLAGLAALGLAMARRKLGKIKEAINACNEAQKSLGQESIPSFINISTLRAAIEEEYSRIHEARVSFPGPIKELGISLLPEKVLPVFNILAGEGRITGSRATDLNLLSREDYEQYSVNPIEEVVIDLIECPSAQNADYILEIDSQAKTEGDLKPGDWVFIQEHKIPDRLHGKTVVILTEEDEGTIVGLRTCIKAEDHYFLKAKSRGTTSIIIITNYKAFLWEKPNVEALYSKKEVIKRTDAVQVSGAVIDNGCTLRQVQSKTTGAFIWRIPQISHISAGLDRSIAEENIEAYVNLREEKSIEEAIYFTFIVDGDSMNGDGIFLGDSVLIRQQAEVKNGDIAAIVITTPDLKEPLGTLKRYYIDEREGRQHWFLKSSNPTAQHLVVVPPDTDVAQIRRMYTKEIQAGKIRLYEKAELSVAGKYVKVVGKH